MRKIVRNICISLAILLTIAAVTTIGLGENTAKDVSIENVEYGVNLVQNGGFETPSVDPSIPANWYKYNTGTGQLNYPESGRIGGSSISSRFPTKENDKRADWVQNINGINVAQKYRITGYMKTSSVSEFGGAYIAVDWKNSVGGYIGTSVIARRIGTTGWTFYEGIVKPMPGSSRATIVLGMSDSSGKVWFDDISFRTAVCG